VPSLPPHSFVFLPIFYYRLSLCSFGLQKVKSHGIWKYAHADTYVLKFCGVLLSSHVSSSHNVGESVPVWGMPIRLECLYRPALSCRAG
jgi:hypothetical protein